jgi:histidyl-tRNA synthetase
VLAEEGDRDRVLRSLQELRRAGVAADLDYAGRSFKGQMTQAARSGARTVVIVRGEDAMLRRQGVEDQPVSLDDLVATLTP